MIKLKDLMKSENEPCIGDKKWKLIKKLMTCNIVISSKSSIEDIQVGYLFLSKKYFAKKLSIFDIRKNLH